MRPLNIAHRGGAALRPENTLAAFGTARALGADGAELDVQLSADGVVVLHHDFRLNPGYACLRGGSWSDDILPRIKDLTLEELWRYNIGVPRPGSEYARAHPLLKDANGEGIPTLETLIRIEKIYPTPFLLLVELKCDLSEDSAEPVALADATLKVIEDADFLDHVVFVGFDWRALMRVKQKQPAARCWFTTDKLYGDVTPVLDAIKASGGEGWFPNFRDLTIERAAQARARGLKLAAWTVNDPAEMRRLTELGIDAICTDRPDVLEDLAIHLSQS